MKEYPKYDLSFSIADTPAIKPISNKALCVAPNFNLWNHCGMGIQHIFRHFVY